MMALRRQDIHDSDEQKNNATKRTRITFDVSLQLRRRIKMAADQQDISIGEYLGRILEQVVPEETLIAQQIRPLTPNTLNSFLQIRDEIMQERDGIPFSDSVEIIHQMRDERTKELGEL